MQTHFDSQAWLKLSHSHGVNLSLKELMYYKAKAQLLELAPKVRIKNTLAGQYLAPHKGRGMEFAEVRHYQHGDDIRSIDWRVTARTGETHTKLFQDVPATGFRHELAAFCPFYPCFHAALLI